jgi:hypothetical protein
MTPISIRLEYAATGTEATQNHLISENGFAQNIIIDATDLPADTTINIKVTDYDSYDLFDSASVVGGTVARFGGYKATEIGSLPLDYGYTVSGTLSKAWGTAGGHVHVKFYCKSLGRGE